MLILKKINKSVAALLCFAAAAGLALAIGTSAQAQLDDEKLNIVNQSCIQAQVLVQQIRYDDAATRVNRGQAYESLLSDLINPLNSRTAANGFNNEATTLTAVATRYQKAVVKFKNDYEVYDDTIGDVLKTKCRDKPELFYDYLEKARLQRGTIAADVATLTQLIEEYRAAAIKLQKVAV